KGTILQVKSKGIEAQGYDSPQGFVVLASSRAVRSETPSIHNYIRALRASLVERGVFVLDGGSYRVTQDYVFNSPSTAAGVILGQSANGRVLWHDKNGRTLKDIQEAG